MPATNSEPFLLSGFVCRECSVPINSRLNNDSTQTVRHGRTGYALTVSSTQPIYSLLTLLHEQSQAKSRQRRQERQERRQIDLSRDVHLEA